MPSGYEPEFAKVFAPMAAAMAEAPKFRPGNLEDCIRSVQGFYGAMVAQLPDFPDVSHKIYHCTSKDGTQIPVYHFFKSDLGEKPKEKGSAVIFYHGGGFLTGSAEFLRRQIEARVLSTGVPFFAVDYRLAPEHQYPKPMEDCYATLTWLHEHADDFNVDARRIGIYGESAGAGLAASVALLARDNAISPPLAKQILIYPMLDDRNITVDPLVEPLATWSHDNNATAWTAMLGQPAGSEGVSHYAAPARAPSLENLPSTYIDVGSLDIFLPDSMAYIQRLYECGSEVELHVWPSLPHGFEGLAPNSKYGKMAFDSRDAVITSL